MLLNTVLHTGYVPHMYYTDSTNLYLYWIEEEACPCPHSVFISY